MLYEFAMTPDLFDASVVQSDARGGIVLLELLKGIAENGLIANLHKGRWERHIFEERIKTLSPALKDKVLNWLKLLHDRHRLVRHPKRMAGDPGNDMEWLELAFNSHERIPFQGIILSQLLKDTCGRECDAMIEFFGSLDSKRWEDHRKRNLRVVKTEARLREAFSVILRYTKTLILIDPYLNAHESRYFDTVKICSNVLGQRGHDRLKGRIDIHAEFEKQKPEGISISDVFNEWEQRLSGLVNADGHRFRVFLWESMFNSERLHDRFVLTDQCCISVPGGLDCRSHSHANSTDWNLLDEEARRFRLDEYDQNLSPFKLLGYREIPG